MGAPYFQVEKFCAANGVMVFSSNYALYADMSQRVMSTLETLCSTVEVYSIDEAFLYLADYPAATQDLKAYGEKLKKNRRDVYRHPRIWCWLIDILIVLIYRP